MLEQIKWLTKLELCNLYGLNTLRFSRDRKVRKRAVGMLAVWIVVLCLLVFYVGGLSYGLIFLGVEDVVLPYLIAISSLLIFVFGVLKAGDTIFRKEGYDIFCSLPVSKIAVALSRLFRMYVEDLLVGLMVLLPGIVVYAWKIRPAFSFYLTIFFGIWSVPLLPIVGACLIGTLIMGVTSRMRHKSLVATGLSILVVLMILYFSSRLAVIEDSFNPDVLRELSQFVFILLRKLYPPAVWLGTAMNHGDFLQTLFCSGISLMIFVGMAGLISHFFHQICRNLFSSFARHDYKLGEQKETPVLSALCIREFRRYFSSSIYVTNTIIGPIMGCVLSGALLFADVETLKEILPTFIRLESLIPFALAGTFCMMTTTATSISMEGKNWWIVQSLPLSIKTILDAKIGMNLLLLCPFYLLSELLMIFAIKPAISDLIWILLIPAIMILFSCVYGIAINLHFPVMEWESEVSIVKQSVSSILGGMGGFFLSMLCAVSVILTPEKYMNFLRAGICFVLLILTSFLYYGNNRKKSL